jgi:hypothetical protein
MVLPTEYIVSGLKAKVLAILVTFSSLSAAVCICLLDNFPPDDMNLHRVARWTKSLGHLETFLADY